MWYLLIPKQSRRDANKHIKTGNSQTSEVTGKAKKKKYFFENRNQNKQRNKESTRRTRYETNKQINGSHMSEGHCFFLLLTKRKTPCLELHLGASSFDPAPRGESRKALPSLTLAKDALTKWQIEILVSWPQIFVLLSIWTGVGSVTATDVQMFTCRRIRLSTFEYCDASLLEFIVWLVLIFRDLYCLENYFHRFIRRSWNENETDGRKYFMGILHSRTFWYFTNIH